MELLLALLAIAAAFFALWLAVHWVLGPLDRAAKNRHYPIQFTVADFLCLFVQMQLVLAWPVELLHNVENKYQAALIVVGTIFLVLFVWWMGVRTLSRAGVHNTLGRALTLAIAIPGGYAGSLAIPIIAAVIMGPGTSPTWQWRLSLIEFGLVLMIVGLGFMTRRIVSAARRDAVP